jgi:hypothetical protein
MKITYKFPNEGRYYESISIIEDDDIILTTLLEDIEEKILEFKSEIESCNGFVEVIVNEGYSISVDLLNFPVELAEKVQERISSK